MSKSNSGLILINKPAGYSSQYIVTGVKRAFSAKKAGHTGTLDKMASGMLPICIGDATKFSSYLETADKTYEAKILFGYQSSTGDIEGDCIGISHKIISEQQLESALLNFIGEISQIPPMYSALKHKGTPLYKLARNGQEIERKPRRVTIYKLKILDYCWPWALIEVKCSKGTYIRTLAEDIACSLGILGYLVALHRTEVSRFIYSDMYDFGLIRAGILPKPLPVESLLADLPKVVLCYELKYKFLHGQVVKIDSIVGTVRVFDSNGQFLGLGEGSGILLKPKRLVALHNNKISDINSKNS